MIFIKHTCFWWCLTFCFSFCFLFHNAGEGSNVCGCKFQSSVREELKGFSGNWKQFSADLSAILHFCRTFFDSNQPQGIVLRQHSHKNIIVVCLKSIFYSVWQCWSIVIGSWKQFLMKFGTDLSRWSKWKASEVLWDWVRQQPSSLQKRSLCWRAAQVWTLLDNNCGTQMGTSPP